MALYLVKRTLPELSEEDLQQVGRNVIQACEEMGSVRWIRSHLTADGRHSFCEFDAPSADDVREHARKAGLPVDEVIPLSQEIGPDLFR